ncbi:hypothetical protein ASPTUDRAFT_678288 [Aspergillus tubingensis CBS 134.48]|uniref:Uncharacterized protein n=1 Tax=Aspergillus tubingensis (strain CBS 134.48) TaxID=767770 RepID=A0A1L9N036_ASPTC|nr:hypothetical protein ASPTUDRAFT_678288 [Aspergillus tubingensis CBS 134.48]
MSHRNSDQSGGRRSSESSGAHSWLSQETVREGRTHQPQHNHEPSNARSVSPLSGFRDTDRYSRHVAVITFGDGERMVAAVATCNAGLSSASLLDISYHIRRHVSGPLLHSPYW